MAQFDSETAAALAQLQYEELHTTPGSEIAEIASDIIKLVSMGGPLSLMGEVSSLVLKIRKLAGTSYANNLVFVIEAVRNDLARLYRLDEKSRHRIESLPTEPKFAEAISALALRAMHTSVKDRLKRLSRIVVNGVKEDDLEPESLDDMLRASVELKEADVVLLGKLYVSQNPMLGWLRRGESPTKWHLDIQSRWQEFIDSGNLNPQEHLNYRSSFSRLESAGLIQQIPGAGNFGVGHEIYALLSEGKRFHERLQEIGAKPAGL